MVLTTSIYFCKVLIRFTWKQWRQIVLWRGNIPLAVEQQLIFGYVSWTWFESVFYRFTSRFSIGFLLILLVLGFSLIASVHTVWMWILHANDMDNDTLSYIHHTDVRVYNYSHTSIRCSTSMESMFDMFSVSTIRLHNLRKLARYLATELHTKYPGMNAS